MQVLSSDVKIDNDGDGATIVGTFATQEADEPAQQHTFRYSGSGRDLCLTVDDDDVSDDQDWVDTIEQALDPFSPVQEILDEHEDHQGCEDWSARVVNGRVVRLVARKHRGCGVLVGILTDAVD